MDQREITELLKEVLGPNTPMHSDGKWVSLSCPLARWTHSKGRDSSPSSGVSIKPGGTSIFHCHTCHKKGTLAWLVGALSEHTGIDYGDLVESLEDEEFYGGHIPEWGTTAVEPLQEALDKAIYMDLYDSAVGHHYVRSRGITDDAAERLQLQVDPGDEHHPERILFPIMNRYGELYGFSGRATRKTKLKVKDYLGLPKKHMLCGAQLIDADPRDYVILVEGLVDVAVMVSYSQPALGFMSSTLTPEQVAMLIDIGKRVYFFHDDDRAGLEARDAARDQLCQDLPVMKVRYPTACTIETPEGDLRPPADPAELSQRQVLQMVADARLM